MPSIQHSADTSIAFMGVVAGEPAKAGAGPHHLTEMIWAAADVAAFHPSRRAIDAMNRLGERERFNKGLYSWIGFKSVGVPYQVADRAEGVTKWSFRKLIRFAIDGLASFSTLPLRVWSLLGLAISLMAIAYASVIFVRTIVFGADVPGFPSIIISVMLLAGVQLISLGVLGEYLGRVYEEVKARPLFLVAEEVGIAKPRAPAAADPR